MCMTMGSRALSGSTCDDVENKSELIRVSSHAHTILKRSSEETLLSPLSTNFVLFFQFGGKNKCLSFDAKNSSTMGDVFLFRNCIAWPIYLSWFSEEKSPYAAKVKEEKTYMSFCLKFQSFLKCIFRFVKMYLPNYVPKLLWKLFIVTTFSVIIFHKCTNKFV